MRCRNPSRNQSCFSLLITEPTAFSAQHAGRHAYFLRSPSERFVPHPMNVFVQAHVNAGSIRVHDRHPIAQHVHAPHKQPCNLAANLALAHSLIRPQDGNGPENLL
jgi:hypothetical protein